MNFLRLFALILSLMASAATAAVVNATFSSASTVPVTASGYSAAEHTVNLTLNFAPETGTSLTIVNNTALPFIQGAFSNLAQGQKVVLTHSGRSYSFVANYYGGTGNDLVLQWADTRVFAWGSNSSGRLGDGTTSSRTVPTVVRMTGVLAGKTIVAVAAGAEHSLALCSDGTLAAWGDNSSGQLGNNSTISRNEPVLVDQSGALAGKTVVAISAGGFFNLALCSDGTIVGWGAGAAGQLGNNITATSFVPSPVVQSGVLAGKFVVKIAAGYTHGLALCSDGRIAAWGEGGSGSLGNGSNAGSPLPVLVNQSGVLAGKVPVTIAAGYLSSYAATSDGLAYAWGGDIGYPLLGNGITSSSTVPVAVTASGALNGKSVFMLAAGKGSSYWNHALGLSLDGSVAAWGYNGNGELGINSTIIASSPVGIHISAALAGKSVVGVTAGETYSAAICSDGSAVSWGRNQSGQLGNGTSITSYAALPVSTGNFLMGERFTATATALAAGNSHILGVTALPSLPKAVVAAASGLTSIGATLNGVVNANSNATTVVFDYGLTSSYGLTATVASAVNGDSDTPVSAAITGLSAGTTYNYRVVATNVFGTVTSGNMTFIAASNNANLSALALSSGTLSPTFNSATTEYAASVTNATTSITVRPTLSDTTASVRVNGIVVASGTNSGAINLAIGANLIGVEVTAQDGLTIKTYNVTVTRPSANADLASFVPSSGALSPGFESATTSYTLSVPYDVTSIRFTPTVADANATVRVNNTTVASGSQSGSIVLNVGSNTVTTVVTAQNNTTRTYTVTISRQPLVFTYGAATDVPFTSASPNVTGHSASISLGFTPTTGAGLILVNNTGLGMIVGTFSNLSQGQVVTLTHDGVVYQFIANYYGGTGNDLVLQWANTRLLAWGSNGSGQFGDNTVVDSLFPKAVNRAGSLAARNVTALATGSNHSLALASDGTVSSWGFNGNGQLGNSTTTDSRIPLAVTISGALSGKVVIAIAAGQFHNLALCSDGTLVSWGYNFYGQLGNGNITQSSSPVAVSRTGVLSGKTITAIAAGAYHSLVLCSDGTLAAWGYNGNGELGNGGTGFSTLPVAVDLSGVLSAKIIGTVSAGSFHNIVLCTDGTLAGWGYNGTGQLGDGTTNSRSVPVLVNTSGVLSGKLATQVTAGYYHTAVLCNDGAIATWGFGGNGELGNGTLQSSPIPVLAIRSGLFAGKIVARLTAGAAHTIASCTDGNSFAWGFNGDGELGNGTMSSSSTPVAVNSSALSPGEFFLGGITGSTSLHNLGLVGSPPPPTATTLAATAISSTSAVLNGTINANGTSTVPVFDYGLTTSYGSKITATPSEVTGSATTFVSTQLTGLSPGTTYHYRLTGTSIGGTSNSANVIFTTSGFNANLASLILSSGSIQPNFSPLNTSYAANVSSTTSSITVTPTAATPTSTVTVNGAPVASGTASLPIFLMPGNNLINIVVTAQDGATTKTYSINVTRLSPAPEIFVTQSGSTIVDGGSKNFGVASGGRSTSLTFIIHNTGNSPLTGLGVDIDGLDAAMFSVTTQPLASVEGPGGTTTFTVRFAPTSSGLKSAELHISNNDSDENPFNIALNGSGLSLAQDTDGDGLSDALEFQMEALGFDWQNSQPALVAVYLANSGSGGYTRDQIQALNVDAPLLSKDPTSGLFKLTMGLRKSTDLKNFAGFPMTAPQISINTDGKLEFRFTSPDNAAFYRVEAK